jgi:predicted short-subunit dehydrogenase-like oxidoreductase (DUF2520 family)
VPEPESSEIDPASYSTDHQRQAVPRSQRTDAAAGDSKPNELRVTRFGDLTAWIVGEEVVDEAVVSRSRGGIHELTIPSERRLLYNVHCGRGHVASAIVCRNHGARAIRESAGLFIPKSQPEVDVRVIEIQQGAESVDKASQLAVAADLTQPRCVSKSLSPYGLRLAPVGKQRLDVLCND